MLSSVMWSGVERYALDICRHFRDCGNDVTVVSRDARAVDNVFRHHSIPVKFAPLGGFFSYDAVKALASVIGSSPRRTIVHCHDTRDAFSVLVARKLTGRQDIGVVLTRHYVRHAGRSPLHKYVYRNVDDIIFVSQAAKEGFFSGWRAKNTVAPGDPRLHMIHNSLNIELQAPAAEPEKGPVTAIYLGRLAPYKGLEQLIDALSNLTDVKLRLRLVGTGHPDYVDSIRSRAITAGVMHMIDWPRHREQTDDLIRQSHFGVAPSTAPEAFGLSNIECMAEGRPVIATDNGAQHEYITDGKEGILVPPKNADILAIEMRRLAVDGALRRKLGAAARERFGRELAWPRFAGQLEEIYCSFFEKNLHNQKK